MMRALRLGGCATLLWLAACSGTLAPAVVSPDAAQATTALLAPPVAAQREHLVESPNGARSDPYYWLRDDTRTNADVLAYLAAENAWTEQVMAPLKPLEDKLYAEIVSRVPPNDADAPVFDRGWWLYTRYEAGKDYPVFARRRGSMDAPEEVLLDGNAIAGTEFFSIGGLAVSPDGTRLAWMDDHVGRRQYVLHVKDLKTGELLSDQVLNCQGDLAWMSDNRSLLYTEKDPVTLLGKRVKRHVLGTDPTRDAVVYEEKDDRFYIGVARSRSGRFVYIGAFETETSEWLYADAGAAEPVFRPVIPREDKHLYGATDFGSDFIIRSNWEAPNFRIARAPIGKAGDRKRWREVVAPRSDVLIEGFQAYKDHLALNERADGVLRLRVKPWSPKEPGEIVAAAQGSFADQLLGNPDDEWPVVRWVHSTLSAPTATWEYDLKTRAKRQVKIEPVPGFDPSRYANELVFATARDGRKIPVSLAWKRGTPRDGSAPLMLTGYGSYGLSSDPYFDSARVSLLDRGFVIGIAHVRGGQEMGRSWYDDGRLFNKRHTFTDFVDVTDDLVARRVASADKVFAMGGSAGGLLMGVLANEAPERFRGIVAAVPFVDIVTTMLDDSIPLTTNEYREWGDPREAKPYAYMLSYSPYDNVKRQAYPAMLVTTGLWDSQVQYYEPAKWVAKLRTLNTGQRPLLMKTNMEAGHGGTSGRYKQQKDKSLIYAFMLGELGVRE